jgi:hypothetical protein
MSIKDIRELEAGENGTITLEGKLIDLNPIGVPINVAWSEQRPSPHEDRFVEEYDKRWNVPENADAFIRGTRNSRVHEQNSEFTKISYTVQFYQLN